MSCGKVIKYIHTDKVYLNKVYNFGRYSVYFMLAENYTVRKCIKNRIKLSETLKAMNYKGWLNTELQSGIPTSLVELILHIISIFYS